MIGQVEGNAIVLDIGGGRYLVFEHLHQGSALVRPAQSVTRGQRIASVGNTGELALAAPAHADPGPALARH